MPEKLWAIMRFSKVICFYETKHIIRYYVVNLLLRSFLLVFQSANVFNQLPALNRTPRKMKI